MRRGAERMAATKLAVTCGENSGPQGRRLFRAEGLSRKDGYARKTENLSLCTNTGRKVCERCGKPTKIKNPLRTPCRRPK